MIQDTHCWKWMNEWVNEDIHEYKQIINQVITYVRYFFPTNFGDLFNLFQQWFCLYNPNVLFGIWRSAVCISALKINHWINKNNNLQTTECWVIIQTKWQKHSFLLLDYGFASHESKMQFKEILKPNRCLHLLIK